MAASIHLHINGNEYELATGGRDTATALAELRERARLLVASGKSESVMFQVVPREEAGVTDLWVAANQVTTAMVYLVESPEPQIW